MSERESFEKWWAVRSKGLPSLQGSCNPYKEEAWKGYQAALAEQSKLQGETCARNGLHPNWAIAPTSEYFPAHCMICNELDMVEEAGKLRLEAYKEMQAKPSPCNVDGHTMAAWTPSSAVEVGGCRLCAARDAALGDLLIFITRMETVESNTAFRKVVEEIQRLRGAK